jgi:hypothetical protein
MTSKCNELYKNMMNLKEEKLFYYNEYIHHVERLQSHHKIRTEIYDAFNNTIPTPVKTSLFKKVLGSFIRNEDTFEITIDDNRYSYYVSNNSGTKFFNFMKDCPIQYTKGCNHYYEYSLEYYTVSDVNFNTINTKKTTDWVTDGKRIDKKYKDRQDQWNNGGKQKMNKEISEATDAFQKCLKK